MKTIFKSIALASLGLAMLLSCTKNEPVAGTADGNGMMELSVTGVLGEYKSVEGTKASLVNTPRVGWSGNETVHVFQQSDGTYLGSLTSSVKATGASVATLGGTISSGTGTLVFVYTNATMPSLTAGTAYTSLEISLAEQGADIPFVVYGTAESPGTTTVSGLVVNFSFATSVVSTYAAGLPENSKVTQAALDSINTNCVLGISTLDVSGSESGTITKTAGIGNTNAQGQVLFEIAVPVSEEATSDRSIVFTINSETYTTAFSNAAIAAGSAYSAMSVNHTAEFVAFDKTDDTVFVGSSKTLTATVYPLKSNQELTWTSDNTAVATVDETGKVTGKAPGTATITATTADGGKTATCTVTVDLDYVVMKMGTEGKKTLKWATMNLGATKEASDYNCYGDYYQWGSVDKLYTSINWTDNETGSFNSLMTDGFAESNLTYKDNNNLSDATNDVVKKTYPGTNWRMPTTQEFQDLYDACIVDTYNITVNPAGASASVGKGVYWCDNYDGVKGLLFCDGTNKLFFPAAGFGRNTSPAYAGSSGYYWSSTCFNSVGAYGLHFESSIVSPQSNGRFFGLPVRPVSNL